MAFTRLRLDLGCAVDYDIVHVGRISRVQYEFGLVLSPRSSPTRCARAMRAREWVRTSPLPKQAQLCKMFAGASVHTNGVAIYNHVHVVSGLCQARLSICLCITDHVERGTFSPASGLLPLQMGEGDGEGEPIVGLVRVRIPCEWTAL